MISQDRVVKESNDFAGRSLSTYVTTLRNLVAICIVIVDGDTLFLVILKQKSIFSLTSAITVFSKANGM